MRSWCEQDQRLRDLFASGMPMSAIAAQLGVTKNAVIGRVSRLGLTRGVEVLQTEQQRGQAIAYEERKAAPPAKPRIDFPPPGRCVFPHGDVGKPDFGFCGQPVRAAGEPYCSACRKTAYQRVSKAEMLKQINRAAGNVGVGWKGAA